GRPSRVYVWECRDAKSRVRRPVTPHLDTVYLMRLTARFTLHEGETMMTGLSSLLLPILLSAVAVFLVSSIIHMATPWHKGDYPKIPNEDKVRDSLRPLAIPPGDYMVPRSSSMRELKAPEFLEKVKQGPVLVVTVLPNATMSMGSNLLQWFVYSLVVGAFAAYVAGVSLGPAAPRGAVLRAVGVTAFVGYAVALWQMSIWYRRSGGIPFRTTGDGVLYALATALVFGWLWPR